MMVSLTLLLNVIADSLALLILMFIVYTLVRTDSKYVKTHLLQHYELMKRDKVFRKSLVILALSLLCALTATFWTIYSSDDRNFINGLQIASGVLRMIFFIYLIGVVRATSR